MPRALCEARVTSISQRNTTFFDGLIWGVILIGSNWFIGDYRNMLLLHIITFIPTGIQSANDKHWCYGACGTPQVRGEGSASLVLRRLFGEEAWSLEVGLSEIGAFQIWMFNIIIFPIKKYKNAHAWRTMQLFSNTPKSFCVQWRWVKCLSAVFAGVLRSLVWFDSVMNLMAARWILPATRVSSGWGAVSVLMPPIFFPLYIQRKLCAVTERNDQTTHVFMRRIARQSFF